MNGETWKCGRCLDLGFVYKDVADGREPTVVPCECRSGSALQDPLDAAGIPPRVRTYRFESFVPRTLTLANAYIKALTYCDQFPHGSTDRGLGLLFWGPRQTGKTHLAVAVLAELIGTKGVRGLYWDFARLVREIGRSYDKDHLTAELRKSPLRSALEADVLLLDDLGSKRMPDWAHNTLFEIVNQRYLWLRPTLVTTAFEDVDRETAVGAAGSFRTEEFLIERISQRVRSRLLEMCAFVPMKSLDEREAGREPPRPTTLKGLRVHGTSEDPPPAPGRPPSNNS